MIFSTILQQSALNGTISGNRQTFINGPKNINLGIGIPG